MASEKTLCKQPEGQEFPDMKCVLRQCGNCGAESIEEHFKPLLDVAASKEVKWKKWSFLPSKDGEKTSFCQVDETGTVKMLVTELKEALQRFAQHLFTWKWQHMQYSKVTQNPPKGTVTMVLDFTENYTCLAQDQVQAGHWHHDQATLHPIVTSYLCTKCSSPHKIMHSLVYVSDDMDHDYHAVHKFHTEAVQFLKMELDVTHIIRFSDGCASQYK